MNGLRFSVITVVLNDNAGLLATKRSLETQSFLDYEWIVCDGGSVDGTAESLRSCDRHVIWRSEPDQGIYDAMNKGMSLSHGEYVVFMNAGDLFSNDRVLELVDLTIRDHANRVDLLFGGTNLVARNGRRAYRPPRRAVDYIWHGLPAMHQATYYRRELALKRSYDLRYRICGDYYLTARLLRDGARDAYLNEPLVDFSLGGVSSKELRPLFAEPYRIQRDVLGEPGWRRIASVVKRAVSVAAARFMQVV